MNTRLLRLSMRCLRAVFLVGAVLTLAGCVGNIHLSFLDAQGPIAAAERHHFYLVLAIMVVLVAGPIFLALPFLLWRYRSSNKAARYTPKWNYLGFLELTSWGGPVLIVVVLGYFVWRDSHRLDPYKPIPSSQPALHVQVIGYDWKWMFIYPDQGVASIGRLVVPAKRPVSMHLTSATVMQSFFVPALGSQIYAMGGMVTQLNLEANNEGRFLGENTMYNGSGFHTQRFTAVAVTPAAFKQWVSETRAHGIPLDAHTWKLITERSTRSELAVDLHKPYVPDNHFYFTRIPSDLFTKVVTAVKMGNPLPPIVQPTPAAQAVGTPPLVLQAAEVDR